MAHLIEFARALHDIRLGWKHREGWWALAKQSIKMSYRRTTIGPIWITIQQIALIAGISILYSQLFKVKSADLIPLVAVGICFWGFLTSCITASSAIFTQQSQAVASSTLPISFYAFLTISQQSLIFLHSAIVLFPFVVIFGISPRLECLISVPLAIGIAIINGFALGLWLGPISARYRDIPALLPILIQFALFLSPVFWSPKLLGDRVWIINYNPIAWMIETFRSPILGGPIEINLWIRLIIFTFINSIIGVTVLGRVRDKIAYWI